MKTPFLELAPTYLELKAEIDPAVSSVLAKGWYILGEQVAAFEQEFAHYIGAKHCVGVASGLDALILAMMAFDIGPGAEVIVPSNTYIATALAVSRVGAKVVFVEPDIETHNLDPLRLEAAITERTAAILPVHLYGLPADMDPINALAREYGLRVIEDSAQAHGSEYKGRRTGNLPPRRRHPTASPRRLRRQARAKYPRCPLRSRFRRVPARRSCRRPKPQRCKRSRRRSAACARPSRAVTSPSTARRCSASMTR